LAAVIATLAAAPATAQQPAPGPQGQPTPRQERPDERTPSQREGDNYDPLGIRLGGFLLYPVLELQEIYNDNIYASSAATGRVASFVQVIKPSLDLKSDWNNHMLNLFARGGFGFYTAAPTENFQDFQVGAEGRIDIQRNWNVYGGLSLSRLHEERGQPNTVFGGSETTKYTQATGNVGYFQKFNRLSGRLEARVDDYTYYDNGLGLFFGVIPNNERNHTQFREALRIGYEYLDGFEVWARAGANQRRYKVGVDSAGFTRHSSGWDMVIGASFDLGGITFLEGFVGYMRQNYEDARFRALEALLFGLTGYWNPRRDLWVRPFVRRTVDKTAYVGESGYLNTSFGIEASYNVLPNVKLEGLASYVIADYRAATAFVNRNDEYVTFRAGLLYMPVREFFVGPQYQYVHRTSNQPNLDYGQNVLMLRLGARL
ncbi:MAG TPA: outer membrane beta-barrel protein, partial [Reyranellaceae bacterium]|nr:outer membrane beta-barrel protein [Reyranellaceae bacterium]